jgi:hypothetical protein
MQQYNNEGRIIMGWFEVDRKGLAKLLEKRGKSLVVVELLQNAWDSNATKVDVMLEPIPGKPRVYIKVTDDDPEGFKDLGHAFTLFAESEKKDDPTKRGRFNLGEKLVLSLCHWAKIVSTTGSYKFNEQDGYDKRSKSSEKTPKGSYFEGELRMTREEYEEVLAKIDSLIPPPDVETVVNSDLLESRACISSFTEPLPTEIADDEGNLKKTVRKTTISIYGTRNGEKACIYEMGIPVVETFDKFHIDIGQKVPLNFNRDNVTPAYLRTVRTLVFNQTHTLIDKEEANDSWVREATSDERCTTEAIKTAVTHRFGEKSVAFDPGDPEANKLAMSKGYTVIPGRSMNKGEWNNIRKAQSAGISLALPSGRVTPSPKAFDPDGVPLKLLPREKYTEGMHKFYEYARWLAEKLIDARISVKIASDRDWKFAAAYGKKGLIVNLAHLGRKWFENVASRRMNALLLHEFAHEYSGDHLSSEYHETLCDLGAKLAEVAANNPARFIGV